MANGRPGPMQHQCNMHSTEPISEQQHSRLEGRAAWQAGRHTARWLTAPRAVLARHTQNRMHMFLSSDQSNNRGSPCAGNHNLGNLLGGTPAKDTGHKPNLLTHQLVCFEACRRSKAAGAVPVCRAQDTPLSRVCSSGHTDSFTKPRACAQPAMCDGSSHAPNRHPRLMLHQTPVCWCQQASQGA
jgi:hypothetical protein